MLEFTIFHLKSCNDHTLQSIKKYAQYTSYYIMYNASLTYYYYIYLILNLPISRIKMLGYQGRKFARSSARNKKI